VEGGVLEGCKGVLKRRREGELVSSVRKFSSCLRFFHFFFPLTIDSPGLFFISLPLSRSLSSSQDASAGGLRPPSELTSTRDNTPGRFSYRKEQQNQRGKTRESFFSLTIDFNLNLSRPELSKKKNLSSPLPHRPEPTATTTPSA
jgi:hypothetical protein